MSWACVTSKVLDLLAVCIMMVCTGLLCWPEGGVHSDRAADCSMIMLPFLPLAILNTVSNAV